MNYGPLCEAIEALIRTALQRPPKSHKEESAIHQQNMYAAWLDVQCAQDKFYEDVKNGRIIKGD